MLSKGPGGNSYLSAEQERELDGLLRAGPAAYGWEDQRWTLARVGALIEERFKVAYGTSGVWRLLDRLGWSWRYTGCGPSSVMRRRLPHGARRRAGGFPSAQATAVGGWVCFEDEAGAWLNGPVRRTWGKAGQTPVLRLSGKRNDKISMVAWICFKEGEEPRMIYAIKPSGGCTKKDFPRFLDLLHRRLDGSVTVIWDNYSSHISKHVKQYAQRKDWLTIIQLPSYAPELNPVELLWAHAKEKIANRAFRSIDELHRAAKMTLRYIQRHPEFLIGFLAGTGLELAPPASSP